MSDAGVNWSDIDVMSDSGDQLDGNVSDLSDAGGINWLDIGVLK